MTNKIINQSPFLRTTRSFPEDPQALSLELSKTYLDIASFVNNRTIGLFPTNRPAIGGESWFLSGNRRQQNLRQLYQFSVAGNIPHGLNWNSISQFTKCNGSFTDGTNWYGALYASSVVIAGQVTFYITPTNIVVLSGAGAPVIVTGTIVLEWLSQF